MSIEEVMGKTGRGYESVSRMVRRLKPRGNKEQVIPKVLLFDIETAPLLVYTFGIFEQTIQPSQVAEDKYILSWSAKWLMSPEIMHNRVTGRESVKRDDKRIVKSLWKLLDEADIVIGHNSIKFDEKQMNAKFIEYDLKLPSPFQSIDTLKIVRNVASFTSNKLDFLLGKFKMAQKTPNEGLPLWIRCKHGDEDALKEMDKYCQNDVRILEDLYLFLRPYAKAQPNMSIYNEIEKEFCPICGSDKIKWGGYYYTSVNKFRSGRCKCGAIVRRKVSELSKEKRRLILK
jgi:DNA polymerase III epsilon subunit-like protein